MAGDVQSERGFADRRPRRQNDQIGFLQAAKQRIEIRVTGRQAAQFTFFAMQFVNALEGVLKHGINRNKRFFHELLRDIHEFALGLVKQIFHILVFAKAQGGDLAGCLNHPAERGLFLGRLGVVRHMRRSRHDVRQLEQIAPSPDLLQIAHFRKAVGEREDVNRFVATEQVNHGLENETVAVAIKIIGRNNICDFDHRVFIEQKAAQKRLLGFYGMRRNFSG